MFWVTGIKPLGNYRLIQNHLLIRMINSFAKGFKTVSTAAGLAQFFDRDAPAEMAKAGMEGFQEFMIKPERLDAIFKTA